LWTCPKDYKDDLKGRGYTTIRRLTREEKELPESEQIKIERRLSCFLSSNAKATNNYADRSVLVYAVNIYFNPYIKKYFQHKQNVIVNEEMFALSCMIQWIWRSRIRRMEPISIYIPSERMRELFKKWLDNGFNDLMKQE